jgi:hypothetical protein
MDPARAVTSAVRMRAVLVGAVAALLLRPSVVSPAPLVPHANPADDTLARAERYVSHFEAAFSSVLWHEDYTQEDHVPQKFVSSGTQFMRVAQKRRIQSDMLLLWIPREENWIAVRDFVTVDGAPAGQDARRLGAALARPDASVEDLRTLAAENGRFNIGRILRTFNEPTLTLLFLSERNHDRFAFKRGPVEDAGDRAAVVYHYDERSRPTLIRDDGHDVPARGDVRIDPDTGQVLETVLELNDRHSRVSGRITVRYGPHEMFDVLVPLEMREMYEADGGEEVTTVAMYSDFRRFETAARIIRR